MKKALFLCASLFLFVIGMNAQTETPTEIKTEEPAATKALQGVNWTGNIRELRNIIERLVILCGQKITAADVELYANPKR